MYLHVLVLFCTRDAFNVCCHLECQLDLECQKSVGVRKRMETPQKGKLVHPCFWNALAVSHEFRFSFRGGSALDALKLQWNANVSLHVFSCCVSAHR